MTVIEPLEDGVVEALGRPAAHPRDASASAGVEHVQTHISHLYLTGDRVYKLRKAVHLPFLSFATRADRNADCLREIALNRRLAPDVYLGVAPLQRGAAAELELGAPREDLARDARGDALEHCVVMRRLPRGRDALALLQAGRLEAAQLDRLTDLLARFHAEHGLGRPAPWSEADWLERTRRPIVNTFALARDSGAACIDGARLARCESAMTALFEARRQRFLARRDEGRAVDGHGDLHLDHVWFERDDAPPVAIDCIEFDDELRRIDVAAELAFLVMDLAYRGRSDLGERVLRRYAAVTDDYGLYDVVDYHIGHRALVRASVAAVAAGEEEIDAAQRDAAATSAEAHLRLALDWLEAPREPRMILMAGLIGSGKSTVADALAEALGGVVVASDRVRKQLAGLAAVTRATAPPGEGLYTAERRDAVYAALLERARPVLDSGRPVILDATYARRDWRERAREAAVERGIEAWLVEARCGRAETLERLARRERDPERISDAGVDLYDESARGWEPPHEWDEEAHIEIFTDRPDWRDCLHAELDARGATAKEQAR